MNRANIPTRQHPLGTGGRIPYDAEVEFVESTGTQFVDTGVVPTQSTSATLRGFFYHAGTSVARFGSRKNWQEEQFCFGGAQGNVIRIDIGTGSNETSHWTATTTSDAKEVRMSAGTKSATVILVDGTTLSNTLSSTVSFPSALSLYLFAFNNGGSVAYAKTMRLSSCEIFQGSTAVRDFVPVRIGTTGYLFDRVSGQLFGNAGTGDFVLGPDK